jgi:O-antigen ligase
VSLSRLFEVTLNWYVPFLACLMVIRTDEQLGRLVKTLAIMSLFLSSLGLFDFLTERNWTLYIIPAGVLQRMMEYNPSFAEIVNTIPYRDGQYRAYSIYNTALSFGEYGAMIAPIGIFYIIHAKRFTERILGCVVLAGAIVTVFVSGSRGGALGLVVAAPLMVGLWTIRYTRKNPLSLVGPVAVAIVGLGMAATATLVFTLPRLHKMVIGGGQAQSSNDSRFEQARLAWIQIRASPIFGHGLGRAGDVVGYFNPGGQGSLDSSLLSFTVDTGIPGLVFYFGMIALATLTLIRIYLTDRDTRAEIAGALGCSLVAYGIYRFFLSQTENQTLFYIIIALTFIVAQTSKSLTEKDVG